jgi:predicted ATPase
MAPEAAPSSPTRLIGIAAAQRERRTFIAEYRAPLVGREDELARLASLFEAGERLVTIMGPPGVGKTRLAEEHAARMPGRVIFADLTEAGSEAELAGALAAALGSTLEDDGAGDDELQRVGRLLAALPPALVVIDNFEHLVDMAGAALARWVRDSERVSFLVTSQRRLGLRSGEAVLELAPLREDDSLQLFIDRAKRVRSGFVVSEDDRQAMADVLRLLDGLPLAIELAASRVGVLAIGELAQRLSVEPGLAAARDKDAASRHSALETSIRWSWSLLQSTEQSALARCSVFRGGFTARAAEAMLGSTSALEILESLRDRSLITVLPSASTGRELRLGLLSSIRAFAEKELRRSGANADARARHGQLYTERAKAALEEPTDLELLEDERDNMLAALEHSSSLPAVSDAENALFLLLALDPILSTRGPFRVHLEWLDRVITRGEAAGARGSLMARAYDSRAASSATRGRLDEAALDAQRASTLAAREKEPRLLARARCRMGWICVLSGDRGRAAACFEEARTVLADHDDPRLEADLLRCRGFLELDLGDMRAADASLSRAAALLRAAGDERGSRTALLYVGLAEQEEGRFAQARDLFQQSMSVLEEIGARRLLAYAELYLGQLEHEERDLEAAVRCYEGALAKLREVSDRRAEAWCQALCAVAHAENSGTEQTRAEIALIESRLDPRSPQRPAIHILGAVAGAAISRRASPISEPGAHADQNWDERFARRLHRSATAEISGELIIESDGSSFELPGGRIVRLDRQRVLRLLLARLIKGWVDARGSSVCADELIAAGWPGERLHALAAATGST